MSPSSARDPLDDGTAPWTGMSPATRASQDSQDTRPLPRPDAAPQWTGATAAMPVTPSDDASARTGRDAPRTGRTGVASGRLHPRDPQTGPVDPVGDDHLTRPDERISAEAAWDTMRPAVRSDGSGATPVTRPSAEQVRARQRERFGRIQFLPGMFGLLTAIALGALLLALAALVGPQFGVDTADGAGDTLVRAWNGSGTAQLWGGVVVLAAVELLSMLAGGYVAGRMARFSGAAQGVGLWLWSLVARAVVSGAVLLWSDAFREGGRRWQVQELIGSHTGIGLVALAATLVLGLVGAVLGGVWGMRYHRKVDTWTISNTRE
ncbi:hypothetical protein EAE32_03005 [Kocuria tytonicola]|uniref:Uncharacterized protein n=2 Tax=Kocuria tytonicola TaxID=2055946 RepID=A0A3L9L792_9MICC|nr:TIGR04086 family membrane protein [Kocuria tytonicola]RLY94198.1 hypothetical protein EAE32_03005 [Kocuria tytonicola]